jgi:hypothetical protein
MASDLETKICHPLSRLSLAASLVKHKAPGTSPSWNPPSLLSLLSEYLAPEFRITVVDIEALAVSSPLTVASSVEYVVDRWKFPSTPWGRGSYAWRRTQVDDVLRCSSAQEKDTPKVLREYKSHTVSQFGRQIGLMLMQ